ncbi:acetyltransferase [Sphingomicrobium arenosum]|uniref:acetyltransferase n=1 Tax=Sphingomicrobium arenosum TaxID=2233861 RepID=UPI00223F18B5|nr:acetyltransferase [Sphingomicrobium arenosum]
MTRLIGIYGASGFGKEVLPLVRTAEQDACIVFIDDGAAGTRMGGLDVLSFDTFVGAPEADKAVIIAIGNSKVRESLSQRMVEAGISQLEARARNAVVMDDVELGAGAVLCPFVTLTSNITVGRSFHANIYSYVAHDCVIGDFVTFAPRVSCNGNVHIGDHAYIGTGAILRQGTPDNPLTIGEGAVVGMGAIVTKPVPPGVTVIGNPARPLEKK